VVRDGHKEVFRVVTRRVQEIRNLFAPHNELVGLVTLYGLQLCASCSRLPEGWLFQEPLREPEELFEEVVDVSERTHPHSSAPLLVSSCIMRNRRSLAATE